MNKEFADRREEGLRALASMIADAIRRGIPPEGLHPDVAVDVPIVNEDEIIKRWESDGEGNVLYTETVPIEVFRRRKSKKLK
jgi:hypothetical protein